MIASGREVSFAPVHSGFRRVLCSVDRIGRAFSRASHADRPKQPLPADDTVVVNRGAACRLCRYQRRSTPSSLLTSAHRCRRRSKASRLEQARDALPSLC
eukprot:5645799-Pleurochrysis_carterae.AAC.1